MLGIVLAVGITALVNYSHSQKLRAAANDLVTMLNVAKSNALSQLITFPTTNCLNKRLDGYEVTITIPSNYQINVVCSGITTDHYQVMVKSLPGNIVFDPASQTAFFFPVLAGGVITSGMVKLMGFGQTKIITVSNTGIIR